MIIFWKLHQILSWSYWNVPQKFVELTRNDLVLSASVRNTMKAELSVNVDFND